MLKVFHDDGLGVLTYALFLDMNYITVVYGITIVYGLLDWFLRARFHFLGIKTQTSLTLVSQVLPSMDSFRYGFTKIVV